VRQARTLQIVALLSILLLVFASLPQIIPKVKAQYTNWTFTDPPPILTIIAEDGYGDSWENAYKFSDIALGDVWGYVGAYWFDLGNSQYYQNMEIQIGDGSTQTYFWDENVQIAGSVSTNFYDVSSTGHLRLGEIFDSANKLSQCGVEFLALSGGNYLISTLSDSAEVEIYSCLFQTEKSLSPCVISAGTNDTVYNSMFDNVRLANVGTATSTPDFYDIEIKNIGGTTATASRTAGTTDKLFIYDCPRAFLMSTSWAFSVTNTIVRNVTYLAQLSGSVTGNKYFINMDSDCWKWYPTTWAAGSTGKILRQYTFDLTATYPNGTAFSNANVTISNTVEGIVYEGVTDTNGDIPQQILTMGHYNKTGKNTIYSYNPYWLNATSQDGSYIYYKSWTVENLANWEIALLPLTGTYTQDNLYQWFGAGALLVGVFSFVFLFLLAKKHT
jgi:hypothetical protein